MIILLFTIISCKSSLPVTTEAEIATLNLIISNRNLRIESDWTYSQITSALQQVMTTGLMPLGISVNATSLMGSTNFLEVKKDSIIS